MTAIRIHAVSLGCPKNRVDTERLLGSVDAVAVAAPDEAEVVLINTCAFIQPAIKESLNAIFETAKTIASLPRKPVLAVAGCLVSRFGKELAKEIPEIGVLVSTREIELWPGRLAKALSREIPALPGRLVSTPPGYAYLKISEGCGHKCAFCAIPAIRGRHASRDPLDLAREAQMLIAQGARELILIGQDVTAYGRDLGLNLRHLLDKLLVLPGLSWLRLLYLYPAGLTGELLGYLSQAGPPLLPYFDIPLQHAHPDILRAMGRPFAADPMRVVDRVRGHFPEAVLRTSLMTGFPGEKAVHFKALLDLVGRARFHHLGVFAYSPEAGTRAALMQSRPAPAVARRRRAEVMELQAGISEEILGGYLGEELDVLVDAAHPEWPGLHLGRTWFQAPEADGVTFVSGPGVFPGAMVAAQVEETKTYDLVALA